MARSSKSIGFYAPEPHYVDHLAPIAQRVPDAMIFGYGQPAEQRWREWGFEPLPFASKYPATDILVVGAVRNAPHSKGVVLVEHGAGQSYGNEHSAYTGGLGREHLDLVLAPSHRVANAHPHGVAIGSPHVDHLRSIRARALFSDRNLVVFSFHWPCRVHPLAGSAFDFYAPYFGEIVQSLYAEGYTVGAHAHPRDREKQLDVWSRVDGVVWLDKLEQVAATAGVFVADNTSALYELAAIGVPVVCLDDPAWQNEEPVGLRFWDMPPGPVVTRPERIIDKVIDVATDSDGFWRDWRRRVSQRVYAYDDNQSAERAAQHILALAAD